ncbi:MAG: nitroreductase family protein [Chloroflexi bacterium]|nr:nitroreductase family protein [Chloroflexota bacterium]
MDIDALTDLARRRRSIRKFKPDPIPDGDIRKILEVARWSMSGANAQPWEFIVVKDPDTRAAIFDLYRTNRARVEAIEMTRVNELRHAQVGIFKEGGHAFKDAPVIVVLLGDPRTLQATFLIGQILSGERKTFHSNLAIATYLIQLAASALGIGAQWVSIGQTWEGPLKTLLGVPEEYMIPQVIPLGYYDYKPAPPYRRKMDEMLHFDKYDRSKYRSDEEVINFIAGLHKRSAAAYHVGSAARPKAL